MVELASDDFLRLIHAAKITAYYKPDAQRLVELVVPTSGAKTVTVELVVLSGGQITVEAKVDDAADVAASAKIGA